MEKVKAILMFVTFCFAVLNLFFLKGSLFLTFITLISFSLLEFVFTAESLKKGEKKMALFTFCVGLGLLASVIFSAANT